MDYNVVTTDHCAVDYLTFKFEVKIQGGFHNFKKFRGDLASRGGSGPLKSIKVHSKKSTLGKPG